jgi:hypothetical protein
VAAVRGQPRLRLVLHHERHALTQPRAGRRRHRLDQATTRQVDAGQAGVRDVRRERAELNHRQQRPEDVVGLVLRHRRHLDMRRRPRPADRLALLVPAVEDDRPVRMSLRADDRRRERALTPLLRPDELRPAEVDEPPGDRMHPVVMQRRHQLLVGEQERLAHQQAVRDRAGLLDQPGNLVAERRKRPALDAQARVGPCGRPAVDATGRHLADRAQPANLSHPRRRLQHLLRLRRQPQPQITLPLQRQPQPIQTPQHRRGRQLLPQPGRVSRQRDLRRPPQPRRRILPPRVPHRPAGSRPIPPRAGSTGFSNGTRSIHSPRAGSLRRRRCERSFATGPGISSPPRTPGSSGRSHQHLRVRGGIVEDLQRDRRTPPTAPTASPDASAHPRTGNWEASAPSRPTPHPCRLRSP